VPGRQLGDRRIGHPRGEGHRDTPGRRDVHINIIEVRAEFRNHLQRGGTPTYFDRVLASKMGVGAVEGLLNGNHSSMVGVRNNQIVYNSFETIINAKHDIDTESLRISKILSI